MNTQFRQGHSGPTLPHIHFEDWATPHFDSPFFIGHFNETSPEPLTFPVHTHTGLEVAVFRGSKAQFYYGGMYYDLLPGDCQFLNAMVPHTVLPESHYHAYYTHFNELSLLTSLAPEVSAKLLRPFFLPSLGITPVISGQMRVGELLEEGHNTFYSPSVLGRATAWGKVIEALAELATSFESIAGSVGHADDYNLKKVLSAVRFINENYRTHFSTEDIARHCGLSVPYLYKLFRTIIHTSPNEYCTRIRIAHAIEDISTTEKKIESIAYDCGFEHVTSLRYIFKKNVGRSPKEFRVR